MKYDRCFHWKKDPLRGYNSQIQNKPWRAVSRYAFGGSQELSNARIPAAASPILMEAGADVTVKDEEENIPFILSAKSNCTDDGNIKLYVSSGADITAKNKFGYTALDYAEDSPMILDKDRELLRLEVTKYKSRP